MCLKQPTSVGSAPKYVLQLNHFHHETLIEGDTYRCQLSSILRKEGLWLREVTTDEGGQKCATLRSLLSLSNLQAQSSLPPITWTNDVVQAQVRVSPCSEPLLSNTHTDTSELCSPGTGLPLHRQSQLDLKSSWWMRKKCVKGDWGQSCLREPQDWRPPGSLPQ